MTSEVPWDRLRTLAVEQAGRAHAPYSGVRVGAAAVADDGRVVVGCNVENASIGLTTCAEIGVVHHLVASGGGALRALAVVAGDGRPLVPCGRCRQVLAEHAGPTFEVETAHGLQGLDELLPDPLRPSEVRDRADGPR